MKERVPDEYAREHLEMNVSCRNAVLARERRRFTPQEFVACKLNLGAETVSGYQLYGSCVACPGAIETSGHCTGEPYTAIFPSFGPFDENIAQNCPGYNRKKVSSKKIESYDFQVRRQMTEQLRREYAEKGIEKRVL